MKASKCLMKSLGLIMFILVIMKLPKFLYKPDDVIMVTAMLFYTAFLIGHTDNMSKITSRYTCIYL